MYTSTTDGLVNGDTKADLPGLMLTSAAPATPGVGEYDITASGATNPNYVITYDAGTEKVTRAPLTVTADDRDSRLRRGPPHLHRLVRRVPQR